MRKRLLWPEHCLWHQTLAAAGFPADEYYRVLLNHMSDFRIFRKAPLPCLAI